MMVRNSTKQPNKNGRGKDKNGRVMHPNSLKNLEKGTDWQPGQSGNPNGYSITSRQKEKMSDDCPYPVQGKTVTWGEALAEGGMRMALDIPVALSNLQDRHEGKVTQPEGGVPNIVERQINIYVMSDKAKELTENIGRRLQNRLEPPEEEE